MKIKSIEIENNKALKNIKINFEKENEILNTVVIAGSNGSGKTTLLESIWDYFKNEMGIRRYGIGIKAELFLENDEQKIKESLLSSLNYLMYYKENEAGIPVILPNVILHFRKMEADVPFVLLWAFQI